MSKEKFIDSFNKALKKFNINTTPTFEHGIKISNDAVNTDRVNISIPKKDITKKELLDIVFLLFDKFDNTKTFIDSIYDSDENKIQNIFLGYSLNKLEIYFELFEEGESSTIISYDDKQNEYKPIEDITDVVKTLCDIITQKTKLIITEPNLLFKGGFVKNENTYYLSVLEPMNTIRDILQILSNNINSDEEETIKNWFNDNNDKIVSHVAYNINNNEITLNIYTNESRTS
jgi:uncharacterized protein YaaQ